MVALIHQQYQHVNFMVCSKFNTLINAHLLQPKSCYQKHWKCVIAAQPSFALLNTKSEWNFIDFFCNFLVRRKPKRGKKKAWACWWKTPSSNEFPPKHAVAFHFHKFSPLIIIFSQFGISFPRLFKRVFSPTQSKWLFIVASFHVRIFMHSKSGKSHDETFLWTFQ